eukprot:scaffold539968_cov53-Prasinocladus_malaysianus.AAC.1
MIVRDPYSRLLSGFLDKACYPTPGSWTENMNSEYGGPYQETPEEFGRFVSHLVSKRVRGELIDPHFSPLFDHCGLSTGMRYDLYLKAEEMDEWYADL